MDNQDMNKELDFIESINQFLFGVILGCGLVFVGQELYEYLTR